MARITPGRREGTMEYELEYSDSNYNYYMSSSSNTTSNKKTRRSSEIDEGKKIK